MEHLQQHDAAQCRPRRLRHPGWPHASSNPSPHSAKIAQARRLLLSCTFKPPQDYYSPWREAVDAQCTDLAPCVMTDHGYYSFMGMTNSIIGTAVSNIAIALSVSYVIPLASLSPRLTSPHLAPPLLTSPRLASPRLASPHLASCRLTSPHLASPRLTSPLPDRPPMSRAGT